MIAIGAYASSFTKRPSDGGSFLSDLRRALDMLTPRSIGVHLLPFYPSDGDSGFAPQSWFEVDPTLGSWSDIRLIARCRRLMVDGIYNHIGITHPWAVQFLTTGAGSHRLHVYRVHPGRTPLSPRGGSVLREYKVGGNTWWAWQTFSPLAMDLQLEDPDVRREVRRHLAFLKQVGASIVRLDAAAYYGKYRGAGPHLHSSSAHLIREMVAECNNAGLGAFAQLDCDGVGISALSGAGPGFLQDYAFSPCLMTTVLSSDTEPLVQHLSKTWDIGVNPVRALRTHDGIFLRTRNLEASTLHLLLDCAEKVYISPREIAGEPYEFNNSLPYVCSMGVDRNGMWRRILMSIALMALTPGMCYLYLPAMLGWSPETQTSSAVHVAGDPRAMNRLPMSRVYFQSVLNSRYGLQLRTLLRTVARLRSAYSLDSPIDDDAIRTTESGVLEIRRGKDDVVGVFNFRVQGDPFPTYAYNGELARGGCSTTSAGIEPLGFKIWTRSSQHLLNVDNSLN
jgi:hypothetical protein